jgi:hypothetical protein
MVEPRVEDVLIAIGHVESADWSTLRGRSTCPFHWHRRGPERTAVEGGERRGDEVTAGAVVAPPHAERSRFEIAIDVGEAELVFPGLLALTEGSMKFRARTRLRDCCGGSTVVGRDQ